MTREKSCRHCGKTNINRGSYCYECLPVFTVAQRLILKYLTKEIGKLCYDNSQEFKHRNDYLISNFDFGFELFLKEIGTTEKKFNSLVKKIKEQNNGKREDPETKP